MGEFENYCETGLVLSLAVVLIVGGCGGVAPTLPSPDAAPTPTSVTVSPEGDMQLCYGQTQQFTATAHYSGGRTENVTNEADWSWSGDAAAGSVNTQGLFTAGNTEGSGTVTATWSFRRCLTGRADPPSYAVREGAACTVEAVNGALRSKPHPAITCIASIGLN